MSLFSISLIAVALGLPATGWTQTVPGEPRFHNFAAPSGVANAAGEPTLGSNWLSEQEFANSDGLIPNGGSVHYFGGFLPFMLNVTFNDCQSPALATWDQKTLLTANSPRGFGDPILFTDWETGRTFVSQLEGLTPAGSTTDYTDDDGDTFFPTEGSGLPSCVDHQTVGGGPFVEGADVGPLTAYPNAVYYASQCIADATISLSLDGGVTFLPSVPMWTALECGGLHGHIKVARDGTIYVPNNNCGGRVGVAVSEDNGFMWDIRTAQNAFGRSFSDPSLGIATNGRVYMGYEGSDGHPRIAVSDNKGNSWYNYRDVGVGVDGGVNGCVFPAVVAGDPNRAAFVFYGTSSNVGYNNPNYQNDWYLYIATTFDGGDTWTTVNATPGDPIQRKGICSSGTCRNLLDFFDAVVDKRGRIVVGWDDGCIGACAAGGDNSFTAKASITRQSGGKRMFAEYDPVEPHAPQAPGVSGFRLDSNVHLEWQVPDNGGADLTGYNVYRSDGGGPFNLVTTVTDNNLDEIVAPGTHVYRITALNSEGEGPYCGDFTPLSGPGTTACEAPGLLVLNDVLPGDLDDDSGQNVPADPAVNVRQLYVAEPYISPGVEELWFTLLVEPSTGTVPVSSQWYIVWNRKNIAPDGSDRRFVSMESDETGALSFRYGDFGPGIPIGEPVPPNANTPLPLGNADFGSYDLATGVILIKLSPSLADAAPGLGAGDDLGGINVRTYLIRPDPGQRSQNNASDITGDGNYVLVGNESCFINNPPTASLIATPLSGEAPLEVTFDGSASFDNDVGDGVATYIFNFGDGSPEVTTSNPIVTHTYLNPSAHYFADMVVKDTYGLQSLNIERAVIEVDDSQTAIDPDLIPTAFALTALGNSPSEGPTYFQLELDRDGPVSVYVYDVSGRQVRQLVERSMPAGTHRLRWSGLERSGSRAPSGLYFVKASANGRVKTTRVAIVR